MCGIVGYIGGASASDILLDALSKLEYRGYDSAGLALYNNGEVDILKRKGRIADLRALVNESGDFSSCNLGIGHTRWATHGAPNDSNSHPFLSYSGHVAIVHNGIIENHVELRELLEKQGFEFTSQTDSEVIAHLIEYCYNGDPIAAMHEMQTMLTGSYAIAALFTKHPDMIVAVKKDSPLVIGLCEGQNLLASDIPALLAHTRDIIRMGEEEMAVITKDSVRCFDRFSQEIKHETLHIEWDSQAAEKDGYEHFMLKEITQQPETIRRTVSAYTKDDKIDFSLRNITEDYIKNITGISILACGSAYHAGVLGGTLMERHLKIPVRVELASEYNYREPLTDENTLTIVVSQSGETVDTLHALRLANSLGSKTLSIVNVVGSAIASASDDCIYTHAGPEIAVATTKAYTAQVVVFYMLTAYMARVRSNDTAFEKEWLTELRKLPDLVAGLLEDRREVQNLAETYQAVEDIFFLGRNMDYALALEGSLKLKEISYIHSEAYAAGELKHGTISLIEDGTLVIASLTYPPLVEKMLSNIAEVRSRGARVIAVAQRGTPGVEAAADHVIWLPEASDFMRPSLAIVPLQFFAYYIALLRGCDIDKPRNLAKSVTVE